MTASATAPTRARAERTRRYEAAGFALLRVPLLPIDDFLAWGRDPGPGCELTELATRLRARMTNPAVLEGLEIAAPDFASQFRDWLERPLDDASSRMTITAAKYFSRMCCRPTPYGLFAGTTMVTAGASTDLRLADISEYRRHSRIDLGVLYRLVEKLVGMPDVRGSVKFCANSSLYRVGDRWRFAERHETASHVSYSLSSVPDDESLSRVLAAATNGATVAELTSLFEGEVDADEAESFVHALVDNQLLVPDLEPPLTGPDALASLLASARQAVPTHPVVERLEEIDSLLRALDAAPPGLGRRAVQELDVAIGELATGSGEKLSRDRLHVQLRLATETATLGPKLLRAVEEATDILARIAAVRALGRSSGSRSELQLFAEEFLKRYNIDEWVPLAEALDAESGIGFGGAWTPPRESSASVGAEPTALISLHDLLRRLVFEAVESGTHEVTLHPEDIPDVTLPPSQFLSDSIFASVTVCARDPADVDAGRFRLLMTHCGGSNAAALLGRFCNGDEPLTVALREHLASTDRRAEGCVVAEIVHLPNGRLANVIARPVLRAHEISYLGSGGSEKNHQILLSDLRVTVAGGRVVLWSDRLRAQVLPRLSCAHSASQATQLPVYRFLYALQQQHRVSAFTWDWGPLADAQFLPRLVAGNYVLSRARWSLRAPEFETLRTLKPEDWPDGLRRLRTRLKLPRWVVLAEGDNELPIDFDNAISVQVLSSRLRTRASADLVELYPVADQYLGGPRGQYAHELIIPLKATAATARPTPARRPAGGRQTRLLHAPGSTWLYAKLYCGEATSDRVLREVVHPLIQELGRDNAVDSWFFLRFEDPDHHLRVRFNGSPEQLLGTVLPGLHETIEPWIRQSLVSRMQIDTYQPEVDRYGGLEGLKVAEHIFRLDSDAALEIVSLLAERGDDDVRRLVAMQSVDRLLRDVGAALPERRALMVRLQEQFAVVNFGTGAGMLRERRAQSIEYRKQRSAIDGMLLGQFADSPELNAADEVFTRRGIGLTRVAQDLATLQSAGTLTRALPDLLASYVHMQLNRVLRRNHARQEFMIYYNLSQSYGSIMARRSTAAV